MRNILKNQWSIGIGSSAIVAICAEILGVFDWKDVPSWVFKILSINIYLYILLGIIIFVYVVLRYFIKKKTQTTEVFNPVYSTLKINDKKANDDSVDFTRYIKNKFDRINNRWKWDKL